VKGYPACPNLARWTGGGGGIPQHEALHDEVVLLLVAVGQPGSAHAVRDVEGVSRLVRGGLEVVLHVLDHALDRVSVEEQEGVVVRDAVQAPQDLLLCELAAAVSAEEILLTVSGCNSRCVSLQQPSFDCNRAAYVVVAVRFWMGLSPSISLPPPLLPPPTEESRSSVVRKAE